MGSIARQYQNIIALAYRKTYHVPGEPYVNPVVMAAPDVKKQYIRRFHQRLDFLLVLNRKSKDYILSVPRL